MTAKTKRTPTPAGGSPAAAVDAAAQSDAPTPHAGASLPSEGAAPTDAPAAEPTTPPAEATPPAADEKPASEPDLTREQEQASEPQVEDEITEARVLVAFDEHDVDDIVTAPADVIEQLAIAGRVDPHPDAVAFAKSLLDA